MIDWCKGFTDNKDTLRIFMSNKFTENSGKTVKKTCQHSLEATSEAL